MIRLRPLLVATLIPLVACQEELPEQKPTAPDMGGLVGSYAQPTLGLDASNIAQVSESTVTVRGTVDAMRALVEEIRSSVSGGIDESEKGTTSGSAVKPGLRVQALEGEGFITVHRICPGWETGDGPNEADGALDVVVGFTERGVDPVIWGTATACKLGAESSAIQVSGAVNVYIGENVAFDAFASAAMLFQMSVELTTSGGVEKVETDFRMKLLPAEEQSLEYRVFAGEGFTVYGETTAARGYRAANGTFSCDFEAKKCSAESGDTLSW